MTLRSKIDYSRSIIIDVSRSLIEDCMSIIHDSKSLIDDSRSIIDDGAMVFPRVHVNRVQFASVLR